MKLTSFKSLYQCAAERKGGEANLQLLLGEPIPRDILLSITDDRVLAAFTKKIFQSGFVWRVVENKWPEFEEVFFQFNIEKLLMMPEEMVERKSQDARIIRNYNKVKTIKANAQMMYENTTKAQSFMQFLVNWPSDDIVGLWLFLKKHGQRLGGNTGPYALRALGIDTFILSRDVEAYFRGHKIIDGGLTSKTNLNRIQQHFNQLSSESGLGLTQLSRLISYATGDNVVQVEL